MAAEQDHCHCVSSFCDACRAVKLEKYRETDAEVLRYLLRIYFPSRIENNLKQLYSDTLESVVVAKAYKSAVLQNSQYKYLKTHLKRVGDLSDKAASNLADKVNEGCRVYDNWAKIDFNLAQCQLIDRRRLSINQLYRAQEFVWCLRYEDNIRKSNSKPTEPYYTEEKFQNIKDFIKDSGILNDVDYDAKQITALCSRLQRELIMNPR